ncbi:MAG TPA: metallophosphoesterase [Vicinamibacterales bacterium]|nr:metallophosphoesterase [Vicinamibacterales bacterium]
MNYRRISAGLLVCALSALVSGAQTQIPLPNKPDSLHFAVIGDNGNGSREQTEVGQQMLNWYKRFQFPLVVMMGDNIYGSERPQDFVDKFESPYKALLDKGVKFFACLGNHDSREQRYYKLYNMDGKLYYSFKAPTQDVRFFVFESTYMDPDQLKWIEGELQKSREKWKICYFHHPLYSSARTHGSTLKLRDVLEPLFIKYNVSLVLNGHDHTYERIKPQNGIAYFVEGSSGQLRDGDLQKGSPLTAFGNDTDQTFMLMEIDGDTLTFNTITRTGTVIDSGVIPRRY